MNRSNLNIITRLVSIVLLLILISSGCAHQSNKVEQVPDPVPKPELPPIIKRANALYNAGKALLLEGQIDESKVAFDRTVDILMNADVNNPIVNKYLRYYIDDISKIELEYLKDNTRESGQTDGSLAFLDEIISTPLFFPKKEDIDSFKKKIKKRKPLFSVPIVINPRVVSFLKAFQNIKHDSIQRALNRSANYVDTFKKTFRQMGIPEDLVYLPIIESGFRIKAVSRARANGMWQFMAATGRMFNLRIDWVVDERQDPFKASVAAAKLLKTLYKEYGHWYLALACYNGGTRRVNRAIRRLKTKDFFKIARTRYLRRETRNYVPAFIASLIIAKSPEEYGFKIEKGPSIFDNTKIISVPSPIDLKALAKAANVSYQRLKEINPELIRHFTPFNKKFYRLRVPTTVDEVAMARIKRLPPQKRYFVGWYRIKRGDSLYSIARKFRTSVRKIKRVNKLKRNLIRPGRRLLIPRGK